jgi:flagellar biosynthesis protein FlhF
MKIQKYTAPDMRTALRKVRAGHGPDVVILSTRRAAGVVELTVASDPEAVAAAAAAAPPARLAVGDPVSPAKPASRNRAGAAPVGRAAASTALADVSLATPSISPTAISAAIPAATPPVAASTAVEALVAAPTAVDIELKALRRLLETQLATLAWNDLTRRSPVAAELLRQFAELGLERELAASLVDAVVSGDDLGLARETALDLLRTRLDTTGDRWAEQGGTLVMVGTAGSGKTSALAAIAARWVMRHGPSGAALVNAGDNRFGAYDHLARLGRLFGLPTYQVEDAKELPALLARLRDHRLVLVDTAATAPRGEAAEAQAEALAALRGDVSIVLTLPATSQAATLGQAAARYVRLGATACIATRLDEATSLGGLLSAVIAAGLQLAYVTKGTRMPDDLRPACAAEMVTLAVMLAERHGAAADEELLARRIGGRMHASA